MSYTTEAVQCLGLWEWLLERTGRLLGRRKGPRRSQACLPDWKPLSPSPDSRCSLFISASLNEFITLWGSALPKCNVLPPLSARRASIESTFIILTFRYSLKEELLFGPSPQTFVPPRGVRRRVFFFLPLSPPPPFLKVLFQGADKKASSRGILNENKNQLGHGLVEIWGAAVWRSERENGGWRWLERPEKAHTNQICSGVSFEVRTMVSCALDGHQPIGDAQDFTSYRSICTALIFLMSTIRHKYFSMPLLWCCSVTAAKITWFFSKSSHRLCRVKSYIYNQLPIDILSKSYRL